MGLLVTIFYVALISPFGGFFKYSFPVFGLLILAIVLYYDRYFSNFVINKYYVTLALLFGFLIEKILWGDTMFLNGKPFTYMFLLVATIVACYVLLKIGPKKITSLALVLFIFFAIGFQLSISRVQAISEYPTKYLYGQTGLDQTTAYLRSNTEPDETIWAMKDVGYYVNNKYIESYGYYFDKSIEKDLINKLKGSKVRYYVVTTGIGQDNIDYYANIKTILESNAVREKQFGNFIIYKAKE